MEPETTEKEVRCCFIVCAATLRKAEEGGVVEGEYWLRQRTWSQISCRKMASASTIKGAATSI
jgi:hypothetical protein